MNTNRISRGFRYIWSMIVLSLIATVIISGCGVGKAVNAIGAEAQALISQGRQYYHEGIDMQTSAINLRRAYETKDSSFRLTVQDLFANKKSCFKDAATLESTVATAVMSQKSGGELVNALSTSSVSGEAATTACIELNKSLADIIVSSRSGIQNAYMASFEAATAFENKISSYPEIKLVNDLLTTYGSTDGVIHALSLDGVGVTDFTWLPTMDLYVDTSNDQLCTYFKSGAFKDDLPQIVKDKFTGHDDALTGLYSTRKNPLGTGCRVYRQAALYVMTLPILSAQTSQVVGSGVDQGAMPTDVPDPKKQ